MAQCPKVLALAPEGKGRDELANEVLGAMLVAINIPDRREVRRYATTIGGLQWNERNLTRLVHEEADDERADVALAAPKLCRDARFWRASHFRKVSIATEQFDHDFARTLHVQDQRATIRRLLARYESPREKALLRRAAKLEGRTASKLVIEWINATARARQALGLESGV